MIWLTSKPKSPDYKNFCSSFSVTGTLSSFLFLPSMEDSKARKQKKKKCLTFRTIKKEESQMGNLNSTEEM